MDPRPGEWMATAAVLLAANGTMLVLVLCLLAALGQGATFTNGAVHMVVLSGSVSGTGGTGRVAGLPISAHTSTTPHSTVGEPAEGLEPVLLAVNTTSLPARCVSRDLNTTATVTGSGFSVATYECEVCLSTVDTSCDGVWTSDNVTSAPYDSGYNLTCTLAMDAALMNQTDVDAVHVWWRATSPLGAENTTTSPLEVEAAPLTVSMWDEVNGLPWVPATGATSAALHLVCNECGQDEDDLAGVTASARWYWRGTACDLHNVKLIWQQGTTTEYYRQQVPESPSSTEVDVFAVDVNTTTVYEVPATVLDYVGAFVNYPYSVLRLRGYVNGTQTSVCSAYVANDTQLTFWLVSPYDYTFRLHNPAAGYVWDRGPVMITDDDDHTLRVLRVGISSRVLASHVDIVADFQQYYADSVLQGIYNDTGDGTELACMVVYNDTISGGVLWSSCLPAATGSGVFNYTVPDVNGTYLLCLDAEHEDYVSNFTECRALRLRNGTAREVDLDPDGDTLTGTDYARMSLMGTAAIMLTFSQAGAPVATLAGGLSLAMWYTWGWLELDTNLIWAALLVGFLAAVLGRGRR